MIEIDINKLKQDLKDYYEVAYFTLGYGAALMQSFDRYEKLVQAMCFST